MIERESRIVVALNVSAFGNCKCLEELFLIDVDSRPSHTFNNEVALPSIITIDATLFQRNIIYYNCNYDEFSLKLFSI